MVDGPNAADAHKVVDHPTAAATAPADNVTAKLQAEANPRHADTVADKGDKGGDKGDKGLEHKENAQTTAGTAYSHLTAARTAADEIAGYVRDKKNETDVVSVKAPDGHMVSMKVADRVIELKKVVNSEGAAAVGEANKINPKEVAVLVQNARNDRNNLAKELGLDPAKVNPATIADARKASTDAANDGKFKQLADLQQKYDQTKMVENAPAYTRMAFAQYKGNGLTDPESGMKRTASGGLNPSQKDVLDAVQLLAEAGSNKDLRNSKLYVEAVSIILPKLESGSQRVQTITKDLQDATVAGKAGNKVEQERLLKDAVDQADKTNTAAIAQMLRDPRFVNSQRNPDVLHDMATSAVMGSTARLQYAQFLADKGDFHDAQGLVMRVKAEVPEVMYQRDPKDPTKIIHAQSSFVDLDHLDTQITNSSNVNPNQIKNTLDDFNDAMLHGKIVSSPGVVGAHELMDKLKVMSNQKVGETADGIKGLDNAQKALDQRKKDLDTKTYLTDDAKKIEQQEIQREGMLIKQQRDVIEAQALSAHHLQNVVKLYDAGLDLAEDKRDSARAKLAEVKKDDPSLATEKVDGKDSFYATLEKGAQEPSWWDRNWRKVAYGTALVAGAAAGVATFYTGPGAVLAAAGTTAGLMGAFGLSVGAGAIAGGTTFLGTHAILNATGVVSEKVNVVSDLKQGASAGALSSFMFVSGGILGLAGAATETVVGGTALEAAAGAATSLTGAAADTLVAATTTAEGAAVTGAAGVTAVGATAAVGSETAAAVSTQAVSGLTRVGRMAAVAFAGGATQEGVDAWAQGHSFKQAAENIALYTALPTAGMAAGFIKPLLGFKGAAEVFKAPETLRFLTPSKIVFGAAQLGIFEVPKAMSAYKDADDNAGFYSKNDDGTVGPISQSTALFGPYRDTRGLDANRQGSNDGNGEGSIIQRNWNANDPGLDYKDSVTKTKPAAPVQNTTSDITDADALAKQAQAQPAPNQ